PSTACSWCSAPWRSSPACCCCSGAERDARRRGPPLAGRPPPLSGALATAPAPGRTLSTKEMEMTEPPMQIDRRALAVGVALLAAGLLLVASRLHFLPPISVGQLWPLWLVGFGAGRLLAPKPGGRRWSGAVLTLIGLWLLLDSLHVWRLPIDVAWSAALALGGLAIIVDAGICGVAGRRTAAV